MDNPTEVIKRNRYFIEGAPDIPHSSRNHADDFQEYHDPLTRMHHAHLHDLGIAGGLGVSVTAEGNQIEVQPGVAVDGRGELIALSADGEADISLTAPGEEDHQIAFPFRLGTDGHTGQTRYLTIQFAERLRLAQGAGGKLEQTPWLRLQPVAGDGAFVDDGFSIVLAIVDIDDTGIASVRERDPALPHNRRLMGAWFSPLRIHRAITVDGTVGHTTAAEIGPGEDGGLHVSVAETGDRMVLDHAEGGNFAEMTVRSDLTRFSGALSVQGGQHNQGDLQVDGLTLLQGEVGIGSATPDTRLTVGDGANGDLLRLNGQGPWKFVASGSGAEAALDLQTEIDGGRLRVLAQDATNTPLQVQTANTSRDNAVYLVPTGGQVGIGTTDPNRHLTLEGNSGTFLNVRANNGAREILLGADSSGGIVSTMTNHDLQLRAGGNRTQVMIKADGKVGIGTTAPSTQLHVTEKMAVGLNFRSGGAITFFPPDGFAFFHIDNGPAGGRPTGRLRISHGNQPGDQELISILQNRNIGIGTATPDVRLHVKGNRIRLTNAGDNNRFVDLRADGSALDLESRGGDLFINNHGLTNTRIKNFVNISSRDFKDRIVDLSSVEAEHLLGELHPVKYRLKSDPHQNPHIGFVAEDLPPLLTTPDRKAYKPTDILAVLTMVIQRLQERINQLTEKVNAVSESAIPEMTKGSDEYARTA